MTESGPMRVPVPIGAGYDILIGPGLLARAGAELAARGLKRVAVVTDETVAGRWLGPLLAGLDAGGIAHAEIALPPGEATKSMTQLGALLDRLIELKVQRDEAVLALGGGVIGDLAGLAAALLRRGVALVQVPTTLLAQVDSAVGGKTAVNAGQGKNLIGAFKQPALVLADTDTLATLPRRELLAGYAEVVKYGLIDDPELFAWLERAGQSVLALEPDALSRAIAESCRRKAEVVAADETEQGMRALLNLGHTFAHALEAELGYDGRLLHGEAVGAGLAMAFDLSVRLGLAPAESAERVRHHLASTGLRLKLSEMELGDVPAERLLAHMGQDKKVRGGRLTFICARGIGQAFITQEVPAEAVLATLEAAR
ncbi:MAG: 3-dehydroquinate synthase [Alphaproteobacteria bacterium]